MPGPGQNSRDLTAVTQDARLPDRSLREAFGWSSRNARVVTAPGSGRSLAVSPRSSLGDHVGLVPPCLCQGGAGASGSEHKGGCFMRGGQMAVSVEAGPQCAWKRPFLCNQGLIAGAKFVERGAVCPFPVGSR